MRSSAVCLLLCFAVAVGAIGYRRTHPRRYGVIPPHHISWADIHRHIHRNARTTSTPPGGKLVEVCRTGGEALPCHCDLKECSIDCTGENLKSTRLKPLFDSATQKTCAKRVSLRGNQISSLFKDALMPDHESTIETLDLSHNKIVYMQAGVFDNFISLKRLDLSHNHLRHVDRQALADLATHLEELRLNDNRIHNLTGPVFSHLAELKYLYLDNNVLDNLDQLTFSGLHRLEVLSLRNASVGGLKPDWFRDLGHLKHLDLRGNKLLTMPPLSYMGSLESLDVSENPMTELNNHVFKSFDRLHTVVVRSLPKLWAVEECAFCGLHDLQRVELYDCPLLRLIDERAFDDARFFNARLELVDLANNSLVTLSSRLLPWKDVGALKLAGNPWHCDCQLAWMTQPEMRFQDGFPQCASPARLSGRRVDELTPSELGCGWASARWSRRSSSMFVALLLLVLATAVVIGLWYVWSDKRSANERLPNFAYRNLAASHGDDDCAPRVKPRYEPAPVEL